MGIGEKGTGRCCERALRRANEDILEPLARAAVEREGGRLVQENWEDNFVPVT
uniref:Uncharacterized protein n=1 Tax=Oryza barthii TaxID=65489 RepID=A0A679B9S2_9ORYZ|nr:hypothetical protein [Oryza barthii]BBF89210.1 hypothetical protein [Oryza barthii]